MAARTATVSPLLRRVIITTGGPVAAAAGGAMGAGGAAGSSVMVVVAASAVVVVRAAAAAAEAAAAADGDWPCMRGGRRAFTAAEEAEPMRPPKPRCFWEGWLVMACMCERACLVMGVEAEEACDHI